jgi:hypothetical protein
VIVRARTAIFANSSGLTDPTAHFEEFTRLYLHDTFLQEDFDMCKFFQLMLGVALLSTAALAQDPAVAPGPADAFQVRYAANLAAGDSVVNLTNAGTVSGFDPAGDICANVYVFAEDQQLIACCTCPLTPNHLKTLSVQKDLISNTLTPGVPIGVTIALLASQGKCNASAPGNLVSGLRAWGTTIHAAPGGGFFGAETEFSQVGLSADELTKLTSYCGFIQADGTSFGICGSCRQGAAGAAKQ